MNSTWFVDGRLSRYTGAKNAFWAGPVDRALTATCGGGGTTERTFVNVGSNRCLDVSGGRTADGMQVQLWPCLGNGAQRWTVNANGTVVNPASGRCLDADGWGTANGAQMIIWTCGNPVQSNQNWR